MSVYIPGMKMPKGCAFCKISRRNGKKMVCPLCFGREEWDIHDPMSADHRLDGCPLVPVPPHGDLIDLNAPFEAQYYDEMTEEWLEKTVTVEDVLYGCMVSEMPPVTIPADPAEEGDG